ncbi:MAG: hypothetical protein UV60_C0001G0013 [Parcubacteria group bacterium GW2011_GWA2_43_11]|nr:MAG: hypothetical protein UU89_C0006G0015 [Parcubacteria group bacterium GW2011_GWC2_42_11]KKS86414.1 MAG: hypothetical protein UV60_C0001G0013 [Parcubacteria group bacterium GW2011_GWA2_43_11]
MRYQHLKTARKIHAFLVPIVPILIAVVFILTKAEVPAFVTNGAHELATPLWSARDAIFGTITNTTSLFASKRYLAEQNLILKNALLQRTRETYTTRALSLENEHLRELLHRVDARPELLPAAVIHGGAFSPYDTFFIDIGSNEGVRDAMLVLTPENIAFGRVTKTLEHTAIVTQFSAAGQTFDVLLGATTTSVHTTINGIGSGTMLITVPRDVEVHEGDSVTLPSFTTYTLGTIASIEVAPEDAYKTLYVRSPSNSYGLRHVLVDTTSIWNIEPQAEEDTEGDKEAQDTETP